MERRHGRRLVVQFDVSVFRHGLLLGQYKARDISAYGAFLETAGLGLHLHASVDLILILSKTPCDRRKVKGMIVRQSQEGTGFILNKDYRQVLPSLEKQKRQTETEASLRARYAEPRLEKNAAKVMNSS